MKTIENFEQSFSYLESFTNLEKKSGLFMEENYRLDRMVYLLEHFHNPQTAYRTIHVAGSKGKGSVCHLMASALTEHGYKTGLYTSPHVMSYLERITVDRCYVDEKLFLDIVNRVKGYIDTWDQESLPFSALPTTFELLTLAAFLYFKEAGCDYAVLETGLGGRLDATNCALPVASVITPIDLEHQDVLGNTLEEIAGEKAGIIKPNVPVFSAPQKEEVKRVLTGRAGQSQSKLFILDSEIQSIKTKTSLKGTRCRILFTDGDTADFKLALIGRFQGENAALAWLVLKNTVPGLTLKKTGIGFKKVRIPARMELIDGSPPFMLDGGHTPLAVTRALESYKSLFKKKGILIFGCIKGKKADVMASILGPEFDTVIISQPSAFKESNPEEVWEIFKSYNPGAVFIPDVEKACTYAIDLSRKILPVFVTGSFYMASEVRKVILASGRIPADAAPRT
ncbi:MAG: bifunctional folylpolyglutamate synthase/dihydrofolate synthase [Spirochaetales bacterium]|nr:bifunctional folylpolyglutamate synthase/dihydrofolate synthase [Spirochaetales bacterium]